MIFVFLHNIDLGIKAFTPSFLVHYNPGFIGGGKLFHASTSIWLKKQYSLSGFGFVSVSECMVMKLWISFIALKVISVYLAFLKKLFICIFVMNSNISICLDKVV